jgi:hypothetical protein
MVACASFDIADGTHGRVPGGRVAGINGTQAYPTADGFRPVQPERGDPR